MDLVTHEQGKRFLRLPQELVDKKYPKHPTSVIWANKVENADHLTFCLAVTYLNYYRSEGFKFGDLIVVYGGKIMRMESARTDIQATINTISSVMRTFAVIRSKICESLALSCGGKGREEVGRMNGIISFLVLFK